MAETAVFVCTPEIVRTWLIHPTWLCTPGVIPERIVLDYHDYSRIQRKVNGQAESGPTAYDIATASFIHQNGRLIRPHNYRAALDPKTIDEIAARVDEIVVQKPYPRNWYSVYAERAYHRWLEHGLLSKDPWLEESPLLEKAKQHTRDAISHKVRGGGSTGKGKDQHELAEYGERLLKRHMAKLLSGYWVAQTLSRETGRAHVVFETPEFMSAGRILAEAEGFELEEHFAFADPETDYSARIQQAVYDVLKMDLASPIVSVDAEGLLAAIKEIREFEQKGILDEFVGDVRHELSRLIDRHTLREHYRRNMAIDSATDLPPLLLTLAKALAGGPVSPEDMAGMTAALAVVIRSVVLNAPNVQSDLEEIGSPTVRFLLEQTLGPEALLPTRERIKRGLIEACRRVPTAEAWDTPTARDIASQLMEPWVDGRVWYHPQTHEPVGDPPTL